EGMGELSPFTCPECHGSLLRLRDGGPIRFRCHTGHAFTAAALLAELTESIEGALWNAVRSVEESVLLMRHLAHHLSDAGTARGAALFALKAAEGGQRAELVRKVILDHETVSEEKVAQDENVA